MLNVATKSNGDLDTILGSAYVPDPEHPGELLVQFPGSKSASSNSLQVKDYKHSKQPVDYFAFRPRGLLLDPGDGLPQLLRCLLLHGDTFVSIS